LTLDALTHFGKDDVITIFSVPEKEEYLLTGNKNTIMVPMQPITQAREMQEKFPGKLDENCVVVYSHDRKPNIRATCDVTGIKKLIKGTMKKRNNEIKNIYHVIFNEAEKKLSIYANEDNQKMIEIRTSAITGNGTIHHSRYFPEIMNVLNGEIAFYALEGGPLWIEQGDKNRDLNLHYLIPPANAGN
jgi:hypothetical protein